MKLFRFLRKEQGPSAGRFPDGLVIDYYTQDWELSREKVKDLHSDSSQRIVALGMLRYFFGIDNSVVFDQGLIPRLIPEGRNLTQVEIDLQGMSIEKRAHLLELHSTFMDRYYDLGVIGTCATRLDDFWRKFHV